MLSTFIEVARCCPTWGHFFRVIAVLIAEYINRVRYYLFGDSLTALENSGKVHVPENATCIVTGSNTGLGKEAALKLAGYGYHVVIACRNTAKGDQAANEINEALKSMGSGVGSVEVRKLDLANFKSVIEFSDWFLADESRPLHLLVNNAGVVLDGSHVTADGYDETWEANYLGHYLLTARLLPRLRTAPGGGRVVTLGSCLHWPANADRVLKAEKEVPRSSLAAYTRSKLACMLFARELARRENNAVVTCTVHPGICSTQMLDTYKKGHMAQFMYKLAEIMDRIINKTAAEGARGIVYGSVCPPEVLENNPGAFIVDAMLPAPAWHQSEDAKSAEVARQLWENSQNELKDWISRP